MIFALYLAVYFTIMTYSPCSTIEMFHSLICMYLIINRDFG